jgi:hypothetical protein
VSLKRSLFILQMGSDYKQHMLPKRMQKKLLAVAASIKRKVCVLAAQRSTAQRSATQPSPFFGYPFCGVPASPSRRRRLFSPAPPPRCRPLLPQVKSQQDLQQSLSPSASGGDLGAAAVPGAAAAAAAPHGSQPNPRSLKWLGSLAVKRLVGHHEHDHGRDDQ